MGRKEFKGNSGWKIISKDVNSAIKELTDEIENCWETIHSDSNVHLSRAAFKGLMLTTHDLCVLIEEQENKIKKQEDLLFKNGIDV